MRSSSFSWLQDIRFFTLRITKVVTSFLILCGGVKAYSGALSSDELSKLDLALKNLRGSVENVTWLENKSRNLNPMTPQEIQDLDTILASYGSASLSAPQLPERLKRPSANETHEMVQVRGWLLTLALKASSQNSGLAHAKGLCALNFSSPEDFANFLGVAPTDLIKIFSRAGLSSSDQCGYGRSPPSLTFPIPRRIKFAVYQDADFVFKSWSDIGGQTLFFLSSEEHWSGEDLLLSYFHELAISMDVLLPTSLMLEDSLHTGIQNLQIELTEEQLIFYRNVTFTEYLGAARAENYALAMMGSEPIELCTWPADTLAENVEGYRIAKRSSMGFAITDILMDAKAKMLQQTTGSFASEATVEAVVNEFIKQNELSQGTVCRVMTEPHFLIEGEVKARFGPRGPKVGGGS